MKTELEQDIQDWDVSIKDADPTTIYDVVWQHEASGDEQDALLKIYEFLLQDSIKWGNN